MESIKSINDMGDVILIALLVMFVISVIMAIFAKKLNKFRPGITGAVNDYIIDLINGIVIASLLSVIQDNGGTNTKYIIALCCAIVVLFYFKVGPVLFQSSDQSRKFKEINVNINTIKNKEDENTK